MGRFSLDFLRKVDVGLLSYLPTISHGMVAEGSLVAERWTRCGRHTGTPFQGIPPSGRKFQVTGINFFRVLDGKIVEYRSENNELEVLRQLGVEPVSLHT